MLLSDAESKEQVAEALAAGDEELREDIEYELRLAADVNDVSVEEDESDWKEEALWRVFAVISKEFPPEAKDFLDKKLSAENGRDFSLADRSYGGRGRGEPTGVSYTSSATAYFSEHRLPYKWEFIPGRFAKPFWAAVKQNVGGGGDWYEGDDEFGANSLSVAGSDYDIRYDGDFDEYKSDLLREWASSLEASNPKLLIDLFLGQDYIAKHSSPEQKALVQEELARGTPGKGFMKEVFDFAVQWAGADGSDAEETISEFLEWLEDLTEPKHEEREELLTVTQANLSAMGIAENTSLWNGAPWRLIKLLPGDLRREGRLMRHCVGDSSRSYTRAVKDGEIEIWSLRDKANRPSFTLEVAKKFYDGPDSKHRAKAIKQLKGKTNRTPGFDSPGASTIATKKRDEVVLWKWVMRKLDVSPEQVQDFGACRITPERDLNASTRRQVARALRAAAQALEAGALVRSSRKRASSGNE